MLLAGREQLIQLAREGTFEKLPDSVDGAEQGGGGGDPLARGRAELIRLASEGAFAKRGEDGAGAGAAGEAQASPDSPRLPGGERVPSFTLAGSFFAKQAPPCARSPTYSCPKLPAADSPLDAARPVARSPWPAGPHPMAAGRAELAQLAAEGAFERRSSPGSSRHKPGYPSALGLLAGATWDDTAAGAATAAGDGEGEGLEEMVVRRSSASWSRKEAARRAMRQGQPGAAGRTSGEATPGPASAPPASQAPAQPEGAVPSPKRSRLGGAPAEPPAMAAQELHRERAKARKREAARRRYHDQFAKIKVAEAQLGALREVNAGLAGELAGEAEAEEALFQRRMELEAVQRVLTMANRTLKRELADLQAGSGD
eukprot:jgi/Tetstr1/432528/TSEL_021901.t1